MQNGRSSFPVAGSRVVGIKNAHGSGRIARNIEQRVFIVTCRRSITALRIPVSSRTNKFPVQQIFGMPISMGTGDKHVILSPELHHSRVGTRTIRNILVRIINHIRIINVQWITIRILTHTLRTKRTCRTQQSQQCTNLFFHILLLYLL